MQQRLSASLYYQHQTVQTFFDRNVLILGAPTPESSHSYIYKVLETKIFQNMNFYYPPNHMLYRLDKDIVERFLFPLSEYEKPQVREIARQHGIHTHNKPDSQGICFAPNGYIPYLQKVLGDEVKKGNFVDKDGNVVGQHIGYQFYTIGQRRGLGLNLGKPFFVSEIRPETNEIVVGDFEELLIDEIEVINYKLYYKIEELLDKEIIARPRFSSKGLKGKLILKEDLLFFKFNEKTHENSEGQHIVFYLNDELIGGGEIKTKK